MSFKRFKLFALILLALSGGNLVNIGQSFDENIVTAATEINPAAGASYYATNENDNYYQGISDSLVGEDLINALSTLTSTNFVSHSYSDLPDIYQYSDLSLSGNGKMRMAYTGTEVSFSPGSMPSNTNKEHVWPASWYGNGTRTEGAGTPGADAHNVWPSASQLNSKRGSSAFDELDFSTAYKCYEFSRTDWSYGDPSDNDSYVWSTAKDYSNGVNTDVMYPSKGHRGEIARILMYVATRYRNDTRYKVKLHDKPQTLNIGRIGKLSTLLKWHYEELPSEWEMYRNNQVASRWHHNRNPFVDHPEYAGRIYYYLNEPDQNAPTDAVKEVIETYGDISTSVVESIAISPNEINMVVGEQQTLKINVTPSNASKNVTWMSEDSTIASVNSSGIVTANKNGTTRIFATSKENSLITASATINVKDITSISITGNLFKTTFSEGEEFNPAGLIVTAHYTDGSASTIENSSCEWLDGNTRKKALSLGTTSVICKFGSLEQIVNGIMVIESQGGSIEIDVNNFSFSGSSYAFHTWTTDAITGEAFVYGGTTNKLQFNNSKASYYLFNITQIPGSIKSITATMSEGSKQWEIRTSNEKFPNTTKVPTNGTSHGTKTVTTSGTTWELNTSDRFFTLNYADSGVAYLKSIYIEYGNMSSTQDNIVLDKNSAEIKVGDTLRLIASATSNNVIWESSDSSVATVEDGLVTGIKEGQCTITARLGEAFATCDIVVSKKDEEIIHVSNVTLSESRMNKNVGDTFTLIATIEPSNATNKDIVWSSSDETIASVSDGLVQCLAPGEVLIRATSADGNITAECNLFVNRDDLIIKIGDEAVDNGTISIDSDDNFTIDITDSNGESINATFVSENPDIIEIDENGKITVKGKGTAVIQIIDEQGNITKVVLIVHGNNKINKNLSIILIICGIVVIAGLGVGIHMIKQKKFKSGRL